MAIIIFQVGDDKTNLWENREIWGLSEGDNRNVF